MKEIPQSVSESTRLRNPHLYGPICSQDGPASDFDSPDHGKIPSRPRKRLRQSQKHENHSQLSSPEPKQAFQNESMGKASREGSHPTRFHVRVASYRRRLIDPDNLCPKYFIDCLRYCGWIPDDSAKQITLEVSQEKSINERTEIEILP